jgi:hypothetical protein
MKVPKAFSKKALQGYAEGDCIALQKRRRAFSLLIGPDGPRQE